MSLRDWLLALHLIAAFAVAAALVMFTMLVLGARRASGVDQARRLFRLAPAGSAIIGGGLGLAIVLGVVLALDSDRYEIWDGWVIAGLVLWVLLAGIGQRSGAHYDGIRKLADRGAGEAEVLGRLREPRGAVLHAISVAIFVLVLLDMIFKPGA